MTFEYLSSGVRKSDFATLESSDEAAIQAEPGYASATSTALSKGARATVPEPLSHSLQALPPFV